MMTEFSNNFRVTRGYTTSLGDGDSELIAFFETLHEAQEFAKNEARTLRVTDRNGLIITDDVVVEQLDQDGEPVGQPVFWVKADMGVIS